MVHKVTRSFDKRIFRYGEKAYHAQSRISGAGGVCWRSMQVIRYRDVRLAYPLFPLFFLAGAGVIMHAWLYGMSFWHLFVGTLAIFAMLLTFCVTITIDQHSIFLSWGIGLVADEMPLATVERCQITSNRYLSTWIYTPRSENILVLLLRGGGRVVLPVSEPKRVMGLLNVK
jgi:hypothetical protein